MKIRTILLITCTFLQACSLHAKEDNRHILALYDSTIPWASESRLTDIHQMLEMPLNHMGMIVDYHDINVRPLPDASLFRGIIVWSYDSKMKEPVPFLNWINEALSNGVKLILIEGFGADTDLQGIPADEELLRSVYTNFGLRSDDSIEDTLNPFIVERTDNNPEYFSAETELPPGKTYYTHYIPVDSNAVIWRTLSRRDISNSLSAAVAILPNGGFIINTDEMFRSTDSPFPQRFWDLDIFAFLENALDCQKMLRPDVTTANGCRAAYSHIDGDGIINGSIDLPQQDIAAQILYDEVLSKYPVPITVGTIVGRVDTNTAGTQKAIEIARKIHALPNIEGAVHGYAHVFKWYEKIPGLIWPGYEFSPEYETVDAIDFFNKNIMPKGRKAQIMQWTGDCVPQEEAIAACNAHNILNINGGDSRYDRLFRSYSNVSPLSRVIGDQRQIYASAQNENLYTDLWTTNFGGYSQVIQTFERSESPMRLLPVNVYYHIYSAERQASLNAVKEVYNWCLKQPLCWITTGEYIETVQGFFNARVGRDSNNIYWAENYMPCNTMRLDNCLKHVDMNQSENVIGYTHTNGSLYVTLANKANARFLLTDQPDKTLCLNESSLLLRDTTASEQEWNTSARIFAPGFIRLQGALPNHQYEFHTGTNSSSVTSSYQGIIQFNLPAGTGQWKRITCRLVIN